MVEFQCKICNRQFSTSSGYTQHVNTKHHGRTSLSRPNELTQRSQQFRQSTRISKPEHDEELWSMPITMTAASPDTSEPTLQVDDYRMEDIIIEAVEDENENLNEIEPRYNLRSRIQDIEVEKMEESSEESETDSQLSIILEDTDIDTEDLQGASLDDALDTTEGKNRPERIAQWPNDTYREFMELITEGNISNKIGDKIIKFFNKHSNLQESPLPKSTKSGKDYLNQINSPAIDFKEKTIATHSGVDFKLYYRPIFRAIQALVERPEVSNNFVLRGEPNFSHGNRSERSFGEPYECNWWLETEKTLPPLNNLLSIILYSDATTLDGLGKSSGHPVFLTLGNLPNRIRNSPESKVLLGFLPKVQDSGIKTTDSFRSFQRETFHKCFDIMLRPLLVKPDSLHFGIKGRVKIFAARISFFLADMLEADEITATFKSANCKMPCHTCMVLRENLNKMDLESAPPRTHENMQQVIRNEQKKDHSVHSTCNAFWKFP